MKTIRIHSRNSLTLLTMLCAIILGACSGPWNSGTGTVRINLGGGARAIDVDDTMKAEMVYDISLASGTKSVDRKLEKGVAAASFTVAPGVWNVTIHAYLNADDRENEKPFARGHDSVPVTAGKTSTAKITMEQVENPPPVVVVEKYTITLALNGGSYDGNSDDKYRIEEVPAGSLLSDYIDNDKLAPPEEGYTFEGWYDETDNEVNLEKKVTSNITLYAKWKPITTEPPEPPDEGIDVEIDWGEITEGGKS